MGLDEKRGGTVGGGKGGRSKQEGRGIWSREKELEKEGREGEGT